MLLEESIGRTQIEEVEQPALYLHCAIFLDDEQRAVLDDDTFRLVQLSGQEAISTPFEFTLELHGNSQAPLQRPIVFDELLGRRVTFAIARPVRSPRASARAQLHGESMRRFRAALRGAHVPELVLFNGIVAAFAMHEPGVYRLTMRPTLWKLSLANRYRICEQKNVRDAIRQVCELHGVRVAFRNLDDQAAYNLATSRTQDWLQAGETDYDFLQRLMSKAHLYYWFEHSATDHTLVFANDTQYPPIVAPTALRYTHTSIDELGLHQDDIIAEYSYTQTLSQKSVRGCFTRQEEAWGQDPVATFQSIFKPIGASTAEPAFNLHKTYQYGVNEQLATEFATVAAESLRSAASQLSGATLCARLRTGHVFQTVEVQGRDNLPSPVRPTLDGRWFVLTSVQHRASLDGDYRNEFTALSAEGPVVPVSVQDTQQGTILAKVVDDGHGRAPNDWRYYGKGNFDPEQSKATDRGNVPPATAMQGTYVRLASDPESAAPVWVKLAAHMTSAPEIGALVLVARANDESELPEIQNIVEAAGQMTVTPSRWTADTRVGSNYSTAYGDSKSIRYGRDSAVDLPKAVEIVEKEYGTRQLREASYSQGARYSYETAEQGRNGLLSRSESYGSAYSRSEGAERDSYESVDSMRSEQVIGRNYSTATIDSSESHHTVTGDNRSYETVGGASYSKSSHGSSETHSTVLGESNSYETFKQVRRSHSRCEADVESHSRIDGANTSHEQFGGPRYSESVSSSSVESHSTTSGKTSSYETFAGGRYTEQTVTGISESLSNIAVDTATSHTGVSNRNNAVGVSNDNSLTGLVFNTGVTGSSVEVRAAGQTSQVHVTGNSNDVSIVGAASRVDLAGARFSLTNESPASANISNGGIEIKVTAMVVIL